MGRWEPDAKGRLAQAAMELYQEHGFDQTTVAEIAERAGVTERTFFRHYADKREVLFGGSALLQQLLVDSLVASPADLPPMDAVMLALDAAAVLLQERRDFSRQRQAVIAANQDLQERELIKLATLASAIAETLRERGVKDPTARLVAEAGMAIFRTAFEQWAITTRSVSLQRLIRVSGEALKTATATT